MESPGALPEIGKFIPHKLPFIHLVPFYSYPFIPELYVVIAHGRWDAFLAGDYESIEENIPDEWKGGKILRFKCRKPWASIINSNEKQLQAEIRSVMDAIDFRLVSGWGEVKTGLPRSPNDPLGTWTYGITYGNWDEGEGSTCYLSVETLQCLLRNDLTPAERKLDIFRFASVLLHETCVSK